MMNGRTTMYVSCQPYFEHYVCVLLHCRANCICIDQKPLVDTLERSGRPLTCCLFLYQTIFRFKPTVSLNARLRRRLKDLLCIKQAL